MNDEEKDEISPKLEELNSKDGEVKIESLSIEQSIKEVTKEKKGCYFPSAHLILLILEIIIFILTYVIPKGKYDGLKYFEEGDKFIVYKYELNGTQFLLKILKMDMLKMMLQCLIPIKN